MKITTLNLTFALLFSSLFAGCSTTNSTTSGTVQKHRNPYAKQMAAIIVAADSREMFFMEVSSPDNLIAEKLMLATLSAGSSSTAIDQLAQLLLSGKALSVGVVGKSQAINVMTVKQTLKRINEKQASGTVFLVANKAEQESLMAANTNPTVKLIIVDESLPGSDAIDVQSQWPVSDTFAGEYPDQTTQLQQKVQNQNNRQMNKLLRNTSPKNHR